MKKTFIALVAVIISSASIFGACSKDGEETQNANTEKNLVQNEANLYDFAGEYNISRALRIIIGKKRTDGSCKLAWEFCKIDFTSNVNIEECKLFQEPFGYIGINENETLLLINYTFVDDNLKEIIQNNIYTKNPIHLQNDIVIDDEDFLDSLGLSSNIIIPQGYYTPEIITDNNFVCFRVPLILIEK